MKNYKLVFGLGLLSLEVYCIFWFLNKFKKKNTCQFLVSDFSQLFVFIPLYCSIAQI